jgi:hypothetical protein
MGREDDRDLPGKEGEGKAARGRAGEADVRDGGDGGSETDSAKLSTSRSPARSIATTCYARFEPGEQSGASSVADPNPDHRRRFVHGRHLRRIVVKRGRPGRRGPETIIGRLVFDWKQPNDLRPIEPPTDEKLAARAE